jgi:hypothetical protein
MKLYGRKRKNSPINWLLPLLLLLILTLCLSSCAQTNYKPTCHAWPVGGKKVDHELEKVCYNKDENICPELFGWIDRLDKLRQQIEVCKG